MRTGTSLLRWYRDDIRAGLIVLVAAAVLGVPAGLIWEAVSPKVAVIARNGVTFYADPEGPAPIAADGWFAVIGIAAGVLVAFVAFYRFRRYGVATVLGLVAGGLLASLLAWRLGVLLGPAELPDGVRNATDGVPFAGPLQLRAQGVLLLWSLASTTVFLALTASHDADDAPDPQPQVTTADAAGGHGDPVQGLDETAGQLRQEGQPGQDGEPAKPRRRSRWLPPTSPGRWAPGEHE